MMITTWVVYGMVVGALVAAAARGFDTVARAAGLPQRWAWAGALSLLLALVALAPARSARPSATLSPQGSTGDAVIEELSMPRPAPAAASVSDPAAGPRVDLSGWITDPLAAIAGATPRELDRAIAAGWLASALIALGLIGGTHYRILERRRRWPVSLLHGERVRVSDDFGPAVIGVGRGEIVVPRWLLDLPPEDSRLVVAHEAEHVRARDSLLLFLGWTAAGLLAWNPAAWWMLARLRLAVEVDCDSRMLLRGTDTQAYGALLIGLGDRTPGAKLATVTLAGRPSHLERRLRAMTSNVRPRAPLTATVALLAVAAVLAACEARMPASDEPTAPDVARGGEPLEGVPPEGGSRPMGVTTPTPGGAATPGAGGVTTPQVESGGRPGATVPVSPSGRSPETTDGAEETGHEDAASASADFRFESAQVEMPEPSVVREDRPPPNPFGPPPVPGGGGAAAPGSAGRTVVYLVDGVRTEVAGNAPIAPGHPMYGIAGADVEEIAVLMCEQATRIIPEAVDGLVVVRTRNGPDDGLDLPPSRHLRGLSSGTLRPRGCGDSLSRAQVDAALNGVGMLFVDGLRATREQALAIPAAAIFSISMPQRSVTPAQLVAQYGPEAADGVAVVATKAGDWRPEGGIAR